MKANISPIGILTCSAQCGYMQRVCVSTDVRSEATFCSEYSVHNTVHWHVPIVTVPPESGEFYAHPVARTLHRVCICSGGFKTLAAQLL